MDLVGQIMRRKTLTHLEKWALLFLARQQGEADHCRVSAGYLAQNIACSMRSAQSALRSLAKKHEVVCKRNKIRRKLNDVNSYSVVLVNNIQRRAAIEAAERERVAC